MATVWKGFLPSIMIAKIVVNGFAPISMHHRHHLLPIRKLQGGISSSFSSSSSSRLPTLSSISLCAVNNDDDDDDLQYLKNCGTVEYLRYIHDNEAALLDYKAFMDWREWDERDWADHTQLERAAVYLEMLGDGKIRPAKKRLQSSRVEDAMDCISCLDRKTVRDEDWDFDQFGCLEDLDVSLNDYYLYVVAGCPFSARPWCVLAFYGLTEVVQVHTLFPAARSDREWFTDPQSNEERDLAKRWTPEGKIEPKNKNYGNLRYLYMRTDDYYLGHASAP